MYVGRIVAIGMTKNGKTAAMYRVSSRSFPNREARMEAGKVAIMPKKGFEDDLSKNPYIAYNCLRMAGEFAVATNGSHTDPVTEKIAMGIPPRDALASCLLAMDYEKDSLDTPRIAAIVSGTLPKGWLGIVRKNAISVLEIDLEPGKAYYVATYEHDTPSKCHYADNAFDAESTADACSYVIRGGVFADLDRPVTAAAALASDNGFELAVETVE
jgi:IMP cyclohydrolase